MKNPFSKEKSSDLEKGKTSEETPKAKWGPFRLVIALTILLLIIFFILLFAACHILPHFISEHCGDDGTGNAAIEKFKRWVELQGMDQVEKSWVELKGRIEWKPDR